MNHNDPTTEPAETPADPGPAQEPDRSTRDEELDRLMALARLVDSMPHSRPRMSPAAYAVIVLMVATTGLLVISLMFGWIDLGP